jgi:type III secretion protein T
MKIPPEAMAFVYITSLGMGRMIPIFVIAPFLGGSLMTQPVRNAVMLSLVVFLYPLLEAQVPADLSPTSAVFVGLMLKEVAIGILIGFLVSVPFWIANGAGFMIDNQRGASMADSMDPLSGESSSPLGNLVLQTLVMIFIVTGGLAAFVGILLGSYKLWPPFSFSPDLSSAALAALFRQQLDLLLRFVVLLSAPALIICFLTDFGMGLMNRFAPQLNVFFLSMPVKSGLATALLIAYWVVLFGVLKSRVAEQLGVLRLLDGLM